MTISTPNFTYTYTTERKTRSPAVAEKPRDALSYSETSLSIKSHIEGFPTAALHNEAKNCTVLFFYSNFVKPLYIQIGLIIGTRINIFRKRKNRQSLLKP